MGWLSTNNKHVSGIGKGKWRMLEGGGRIFKVWIKIQLIYNPTNVSLPIKLHKHKPSNPSNPENIHLSTLKFIPLTL
jgi:hypothetical protein